MQKRTFVFIGILALSYSITSFAKISWQKLSSGLYYTTLSPNPLKRDSRIIAFKINPKKYSFHNALAAKLLDTPTAYVTQLGKESHALIAINGGYFSRDQYPLGLRLNNDKILSKHKNISWWGIFYIKNNRAYLTSSNGYSESHNLSFAIQAGPRLIVNGRVTKLKPGVADRSALGITRHNQVIVAITQNIGLSLTDWANSLKQLGCTSALNLDGGSSSQLYVNMKPLNFVIPNFKAVTDAVVVQPLQ